MYTEKNVVRHLEAWAREHLGQHDSPEYRRYREIFRELLAAKHTEQGEEHDNRGCFGMSGAAGCMRSQALKRARIPAAPFSGADRWTFERGHQCEVSVLALLQASGFEVVARERCEACGGSGRYDNFFEGEVECGRCDGSGDGPNQIAADLSPVFYSYTDGILVSGPIELPYRMALSVKAKGYKGSTFSKKYGAKRHGFAALPLDGLHKAEPGYWIQSQLEMAALGLDAALVVIVAMDIVKAYDQDPIFIESGSLAFYAEVVLRNDQIAQQVRQAYETFGMGPEPDQVPAVVVYNGAGKEMRRLPIPGHIEMGPNGPTWQGPNAEAVGRFNPCRGCGYAERCRSLRGGV